MSPSSPTKSFAHHPADIDMESAGCEQAAGAVNGKGQLSDGLREQRIATFEQIVVSMDPKAKQPKADIMDLVRSEL